MLFPTLIVAAGEWACPCLVRVCCCEAVATAACCVEPEKAVKLVATSPINQTKALLQLVSSSSIPAAAVSFWDVTRAN